MASNRIIWAFGDRIRTRGGDTGTITHPNLNGEIFVGVELDGTWRPAGLTFWPQAASLLRYVDSEAC